MYKPTFSIPTCTALLAIMLVGAATAADPQSYDDLDHPMLTDPDLTIPPPVRLFDERLTTLWTESLTGPEADIRRRSAETMVEAIRMGMEGLDVAIPQLSGVADRADEHPMVRFAALRALVALDAESEADIVFQTAMSLGPEAEAEAMAALARWHHAPTRDLWRRRVAEANAGHRELLIAIRGLAAMHDDQQTTQLQQRIIDRTAPFDVRMAAARCLAGLEPSGLEPLANELLSDSAAQRRDRLLVATILRNHQGTEVEELLERLALDAEPTVAGKALERLIEIAPDRIVRNQSLLLQSRDANVRRWTIQALAKFPSSEHTSVLARVTNDPNPGLRVLARDTMLMFAQEHDLRHAVLQEAERLLVERDWRHVEQACRLVGYLDHKPAASRLVLHLPHARTEVHATAAWGLRKLAVAETLPHTLAFAEELTNQVMKTRSPLYDQLLWHLFEYFGLMEYQPADAMLRRYIPKMSMSADTRAAAVWALGHIHKNDPPSDLIQALEGRLLDVGTIPAESEWLRQYCAVSLGRMKAEATLPSLKRFYDEMGSYTGPSYACGWAIEQITGTPVDVPLPAEEYVQGWFLTPVD